MKTGSLQALLSASVFTLRRFPFVMLSTLLGTAVMIWLYKHDFNSDTVSYSIAVKLVYTCLLGITLFFSISLVAERTLIRVSRRWLEVAGLLLLTGFYFLVPGNPEYQFMLRFALLAVGLHLLCAFAPFIGKNESNGFWQFNKVVFLSILTAILYSLVLLGGVCIALLGVHMLFNFPISENVYVYLSYSTFGIFNTWFFLSKVPSDFTALNASTAYPNGFKVFTQFVLLPLVTLYLVILYGYEMKILIAFELPKGWVTYLIIAFSILGILSLLLIYPVRNNTGNKWIQTFSKSFYVALFPLLLLLFVSIGTRIGDYGITELRYFILVLALWLGGIALYFLKAQHPTIKVIPVTLCVLAFLSSFGPWGSFYISKKSQAWRFGHILQTNNLLEEGLIGPVRKHFLKT